MKGNDKDWISNAGNNDPKKPCIGIDAHAFVEVVLGSGEVYKDFVGHWRWDTTGTDDDILAFRVIY